MEGKTSFSEIVFSACFEAPGDGSPTHVQCMKSQPISVLCCLPTYFCEIQSADNVCILHLVGMADMSSCVSG